MSGPQKQIAELEFLTKLQRILGEGLFVASYKYALLLALASCRNTLSASLTRPWSAIKNCFKTLRDEETVCTRFIERIAFITWGLRGIYEAGLISTLGIVTKVRGIASACI